MMLEEKQCMYSSNKGDKGTKEGLTSAKDKLEKNGYLKYIELHFKK